MLLLDKHYSKQLLHKHNLFSLHNNALRLVLLASLIYRFIWRLKKHVAESRFHQNVWSLHF